MDRPKTQQPQPSTTNDDLKKPGVRLEGATDSLGFNLQVASDTWGGTAEAVAQAFRAFRDELDEATATGRGLFNGIVDGLFAGNASFLEHIAQTSREVAGAVKNSGTAPSRAAGEPLDYERLADLVAERLSKRKPEG